VLGGNHVDVWYDGEGGGAGLLSGVPGQVLRIPSNRSAVYTFSPGRLFPACLN
jgi:hypothetical protein